MRLSSPRVSSLAALAMLLVFAVPALAAWPHNPATPVLLTSFDKLNMVVDAALPDGSGGAYVFWEGDNGGDKNLYANHVLGSGVLDPAWPAVPGFGVFICNAAGDQIELKAQLDNNGGIWLCWNDTRLGTPRNFATRLLTNGTLSPAFPANGLQLNTARTNFTHPPQITDDGGTGMLAVWEYETTPTDHDIIGVHVTAAGVNDWSAALTSGPALDSSPALRHDNTTFEVVWSRSPSTAMFGVFNQLNGAQVGTLVTLSTSAVTTERPGICSDGQGGQFAAWVEVDGGLNHSLFVDRLFQGVVTNALGAEGFTAPPMHLYDVRYTGGLTGNAVVSNPGGGLVAKGFSRLGYGGTVELTSALDAASPVVTTDDGAGSILSAFANVTNSTRYVLTSRRVIAGGVGTPPGFWFNNFGGITTTILPTEAVPGAICSDGDGGALVCSYQRLGSINSGYVIRVDRWGALDGAARITSVKDVPGDEGGHVRLAWSGSYLDTPGGQTVTEYDVWRQVPTATAQMRLKQGAPEYQSARTGVPAAGALRIAQRFGQTYAWEFLSTTPSRGFANYSVTIPTVADSGAAGPANTVYMVEAFMSTQGVGWPSPPDSGRSVDNLPPATPSPFTAALVTGGSTELVWGANSEPDLAGYRLYRGASAGFVPGPTNLIALPTGTTFLDPTVGQFYKLAAVDVHGNLSGFALAVPAGTLDVPGADAPHELSLALGSANPAVGGATLRYALPVAGPARLVLYDLNGRVVRELISGEHEAGGFTVRWDGRDAYGSSAPSGMYFARLDAAGRRLVLRIVLSH